MATACESDSDQGSGGRPPTGGTGDATSPAPSSFGDYEIVREVGRGGMGVVYEAWQVSLGRRVALKVLSMGLRDAKRRRRFEREARAAGRLHHTNIVPVFGVGEYEGTPYYVMQFISGVGLDAVLDASRRPPSRLDATEPLDDPSRSPGGGNGRGRGRGRDEGRGVEPDDTAEGAPPVDTQIDAGGDRSFLAVARSLMGRGHTECDGADDGSGPADGPSDPSEADGPPPAEAEAGERETEPEVGRDHWKWVARLGVQAAGGLDYAHSQGILHRDVKPSNLMLDERGTVWVTDFGLAKWDDPQDLTQSGDVVGTLRYLSPEAFDGKCDARSDVYGMGLTLYELLARRPAFDERERARLIRQVTEASPPRLRKLDPRIPLDLATVVEKAIEKAPESRYPTAAAFGADLRRFLDDLPVLARRASPVERYWRWARRNPTIAILGGVLTALLLLMTVGSLMVARQFRDRADEANRLAETASQLAAQSEARSLEAKAAQEQEAGARRLAQRTLEDLNETQAALDETLYATRSNLASSAWEGDEYGDFRTQLDLMRPGPDEPDRRGWEWRYLRGLDGQERLAVKTPGERLVATAISPAGGDFATLSMEGAIRTWGLDDGRERRSFQQPSTDRRPADLRSGVHALAYSADGKRLAGPAPGGEFAVGVYDVASGTLQQTLDVDRRAVLSLAWTPDGKRLAAACSDHVVRIWDAETGAERPWPPGGHEGPISAIDVSRDGRFAVTAGLDGRVKIWDLAGRSGVVHQLDDHEGEVRVAAFSPDGARLVTAGLDGTVRFWDVATGTSVMVIQAHQGGVLCLAYPPTGGWVASGGNDDAIRIWDAASGRLLRKFLGHTGGVRGLAASPDGRALVSVSTEGVARVWDPSSPPRPLTLKDAPVRRFGGSAGCLAMTDDGRFLASGHDDDVIRLWEVGSGRLVRQLKGLASRARSLSFSPDGMRLASSSGDPEKPPEQRGSVTIWDVATGRSIREYRGHGEVVDAVVYLGVGALVASGGGNGKIHVWDSETGELARVLEGHEDAVRRLALSRDGRRLASGSSDRSAIVWDLASGKVAARLSTEGDVLALTFDETGDALATASHGGPVRLWDLTDPGVSRPLDGHLGDVLGLSFTPDGRLATAGIDKAVCLWDREGGRKLLSLRGHAAPVIALCVSRDGGVLASASLDRTIKLWAAPPAE
ncbi:protein kinase domain-containing protein [Paludisphaera soli]|uniref:protein kinase domain-containing protein n=1 Tax=Paludisphaera soli TaxID=2712865 RepID=UPI001F10BBE5|nr:protein kinase [Paludisphaera soli]